MAASECLLILDFQNDLVHPEGAFRHWGIAYRVAEGRVLERTAALIAAARRAGVPVIYATYVVRPELADIPAKSKFFRLIAESGALREGSWGGEIHEALIPRPGDLVIRKWRPNPFLGTDLELVIRSGGAELLVLAGIVTEWVVEEAARYAAALGYEVTVAADCCESARDHLRDHALRRILPQLGRVIPAVDLIRRWAGD
ncbi:MAG TPA: cysteine hydrolase [Dehalococcoidia bacterium]|nr:cysteine hydrolase [Dehalococcoidia bacterium]